MLEKNEEILYFDAHFHYSACIEKQSYVNKDNIIGCSCAHSIDEWNNQIKDSINIIHSFGIHPQDIFDDSKYEFLCNLANNHEISAIGETGFDYYTEEYKNNSEMQEKMFNLQIDLAKKFNLPIVIHCRKANEKLFEYSKKLKEIKAVLFHSFMGPFPEALSLLKKGINGYFSFGKQLKNNNKKAIDCLKNLPMETILFETDAPFQTLKGQEKTYNYEIYDIYKTGFEIRNEKNFHLFCDNLKKNFLNLYKS